jgi:hypothetical protein
VNFAAIGASSRFRVVNTKSRRALSFASGSGMLLLNAGALA